jgi:ABC-type Zn uptake system ZnuABC Zn-binding protein ZnuA
VFIINTKYEISSLIKPGACVNHLVHLLESELKCLWKNDVILINGGTNDIDKPSGNVNGILASMI